MRVPARFEIDYRIRDNTTEAAPGAFVWAPRGVQHSWTVDGTRAFILTTPGGHLEAIFRPFSEPAVTLPSRQFWTSCISRRCWTTTASSASSTPLSL